MRAAGSSFRPALWLAALLGTASVFVVPLRLATSRGFPGEDALVAAASSAVVRAGASGGAGDPLALADLVAFWREFHLVKAGLALALVATLVVLAAMLGRAACAAEPGGQRSRVLAAYGGVLAWGLGALTLALANAQGAIAPLSSVASLLPSGRAPGELGAVLGELRRAVQADPRTGGGGLAGELLHDFIGYHAAVAVMASVVGVALTALALRAGAARWRRRRGDPAPPAWLWQVVLFGGAGAFFLLVASANASTWIRPVPALLASLGGG